MDIKKTADEIWAEYGKGKKFNHGIDLYDNVKKCENFYIGRQWEGLNAPDLPKPVLNVIKRVVSYFISMIVADDIGILVEPYTRTSQEIIKPDGTPMMVVKEEMDAIAIETEVDKVIELCNIKSQSREIVRAAAVDGDAYMYFYFDGSINTGKGGKGGIRSEILDNTSVIFGNPYKTELQSQPYIIVATPRMLSDVREEAKRNGVKDIAQIMPDSDSDRYTFRERGTSDELCTVITKFWKEKGSIHAVQTTKDVVIRKEWDTGYERYPIASFVWEKIKNCYHGQSAVLPAIPNQICINQLYAMSVHWAKTSALPKVLYDATKISSWSNKVGQAIGVIGNPNDALASATGGHGSTAQLQNIIEGLMQRTAEYMGANDSALGNVKPDNMGAIIATQQASEMPLQIQKFGFYDFMEQVVRCITDIIRTDYGTRPTSITVDGERFDGMFDFATLTDTAYSMKVDIGSSSYWSELTQIQTADNLLAKGIIPDAVSYLESIPDKYIKGKARLLQKLKENLAAQAEAQMMQEQAQTMQGGAGAMPTMGQEVM